jgi:hypothetical protein
MMGLTLAERRAVTETTAIRYSLADKRTKGIILDELCITEKSAATEARTGCHCRTDGVLDGAGNAGRQAAGADAGRTAGGVAPFRGAGHR